ncbi:MAG TPA: ribosomal protein S18-alanine N-acetyltransferase [Hyphomicrobiaceae bacterium]|jgi:[ribosomal protein S18]-alanine N-acetyltransferase|nr:ribosomal protein S18-alanine N-acetyltransferase [Hyphomicrobiaceae bacterium]
MPAPDACGLSLLKAIPADAQDCAKLHADLFDPAWDARSFASLLGQSATVAFVARQGAPGQTVAFILGQVAADQAEILTLGVRADWRRQGIASRLIEALLGAARGAGARALFLDVAAGNTAALALYRRLGFEERGRRRAYYATAKAAPVDAVTFALAL